VKKETIVAILFMTVVATSASAIITRHDRDDARYQALGAKYPAVLFMVPDGEGTLVAPQWVLTAAHVAQARRFQSVRLNDGREISVTQKILHPDWRDGQPHDLALVRLAEPAAGIAPVELYAGADEAGQTVVFVGRGDTGTGITGPKAADKKKRAATNMVDSADADWLRFTFDEPPAGTDLEGVSGPGDSGGPALIEKNGKTYIAGVSVFGSPGKYGRQTYGTREGYTRVSTHLAWIRETMRAGEPAAPTAAPQQAGAQPTLPDTPAGKQFAEFLEVFNAGDLERMKQFVARSHSKPLLARDSAEKLAQMHMGMRQQSGGFDVLSVVRSTATTLVVRVRGRADGGAIDFTFQVEAAPPYGINGFQIGQAGDAPPPRPQAATPAAGATEIPDSPAGRRMKTWLPILARGDNAELARFVRENFAKRALEELSAEERTKVHTDFFAETGGLKLHSIRKAEPREVEILAQAVKTGDWYRVGLRVEPTEPFGIMGFLFDGAQPPAPPPGAAPAGPRSEAQIAQEMDALVESLAKENRFSGTVLLAKNGVPFFQKAVGQASIRYAAPVRLDTKFNLGSMNKMFTAVAIAQLAEKGKLSFTDTVGKILPDYPNAAVREKVTIHHLLTHSSGLGSYFSSKKYEDTWTKIFTVDDFLKTFAEEPLAFAPGERFQYSNSGFIVLGKIIEKVSGMSYYDFIRENIYKPAGMTNSDSFEMDKDVPNLATGYTRINPVSDQPDGTLRNNTFQHSIKGGPAGGGFSTVQDLLLFDQALRSGRLLNAKSVETLLTGKISMGGPMQYGYGFGVQTLRSKHRIIGHNGGAPGINAWLDSYWEDGYTVAVMCNLDRCAQPVVQRAKQLLGGE